MNCNTTHYRANSSSVPGDPTVFEYGDSYLPAVAIYDAAVTGWNHIAVVYENKQPRLYVNGVLVATGQQSPRTSVYPSKTFGDTTNHYGAYAGLLDEVAMYDRALTDAELAALFTAGSAGKCKGTTFDVSGEFSATRNPSGVWSYGAIAGNGAFSAYAVHDTPNGLSRWRSAAGVPDENGTPNVVRNGSGNIYQDVFGPWPAGQIALHPGTDALSVVRWTAPSSGSYTIAATFTGGDSASSDVHVSRNQQSLFFDAVNGQGTVRSFAGTISLIEGDVIDFAVGPRGNGSLNDTVFLGASIATPNPTVKVIVAGTGSGHVTSSSGGIDCGTDCIELPEMDSTSTLTAVADAGSTFAGFSGSCVSTSTTCTTTITGRRVVIATFRADGAPLDSDGDTLPDGRELTLGTDPTKTDTDGDGVSDGIEVTLGSDPLNLASTPTAKIWTAADSAHTTDWSAAGNWSPAGAPTELDDVIVPLSAPVGPKLTTAASVRNIFVAAGIDVDTAGFTLTVGGNINALGVVGTGTVLVTGNGVGIAGELPNVTVTGHAAATNSVTVTGNLTLFGTQAFTAGGDFDVNGQTVTVSGNFTVPYPFYATLTMRDPSGLLKVAHNVVFDGNTEEGLLTDGELQVGGNWDVSSSAPLNFAATGAFRVMFNGNQPQTISFCCGTGPVSRRFANLIVANPSGVTLLNTAHVSGALTLLAGALLTGGGSITVAGDVTTAAGSDVTVAALAVGGVLTASGHFSPATTTFTGANQTMPGGLAYQHVTVTGHVKLGGTATVNGNLTISGTQAFVAGGDFDINGQPITVTGNFTIPYPFYATLTMRSATGLLKVLHDVSFDGNTEENLLTAGELQVGGNWFVGGSAALNFVATSSFTVVFNGSQPQTMQICCGSGPTSRRFALVVLANPAGVIVLNEAYASGSLSLAAGAILTGPASMTVLGNVTTAAGSDVNLGALSVGGVLSAGGHFSPGTTYFAGNGQTMPGGLDYRHVTVIGHVLLGGAATVTGNLTISGTQAFVAGGDFNVNGQTLTVTGNLSIQYPFYGTLTSQNPAGLLQVLGDISFDGNTEENLLTAGELQVGGHWFAGGSAASNFVAMGTFNVVFNGTQPQTINFCCGTGPTSRRFANLTIANPAGVSVLNSVYASGTLTVVTAGVLTGTGFAIVAGDVTTATGTNVTIASLSIGGVLSASGHFSPGTTSFAGSDQVMPGGLSYQSVTVLGHVTLGGAATVNGNFTISGAQPFVAGGDFDLNGKTLTVTGTLSVQYPFYGTLTMKDPAGLLKVLQHVSFDGNSEENLLTAGTLEVGGNWFVGGSAALNFVAMGSFTVVFNGTQPQALNFCCGVGPTNRRFQHLQLANASGIFLQNDVYVAGRLLAAGTAQVSPLLAGGGRTLSTAGADVNGLIVDNTMIILNDGEIVRFDNVEFRNHAQTATPLTLNRTQLNTTFTGLKFFATPTSGRFVAGNDLDGPATASSLTIVNSVPANGSGKVATSGGFVINWGSPTDDTDGDGVTDTDELTKYFTDPNNPDTDGDGATDGFEVSNNWNPLIAELCVPPLPGLVSWWKGDGNGLDAQGGNAITLVNGATFVTGVAGQGFSFDGVNDYGQATDTQLPLGAAPRTLQFWTKPAFNARVPVIYGGFSSGNAFYVLIENDRACIGNWGGGSTQVCGSRTVVDDRWHHVAMTYDGIYARLYVDGAFDAIVAKNYATTSLGKIYFGSTVEGSAEYFNGSLDDVRIYDRALTGAEVRDAYRSGHEATCSVPTYDPAMQYSLTANPNAPWTFGASATLGSALIPFTVFQPSTVSVWRVAPGLSDFFGAPAVGHNDTGEPAAIYPPGRLGFHPGFNGEYGIIRWTAPAGGLYRVNVKFTGGDSGTTTDVHVLQNGLDLFAGIIDALGDSESFETIVSVGAGDTVDLAVGPNGNFFSDTTFVDLRITLIP